SERGPEETLENRRYDSLERLIGWRQRAGEGFLFFRVTSFREIVLSSGEKLDVPAAIACVFSDCDVEPSFDGVEGGSADGEPAGWTFREYDTDSDLQYNRARCFDPTVGRWVATDALGFEAAETSFFR